MALKNILKIIFCIAITSLAIPLTGLTGKATTDYQQELGQIEYSASVRIRQPEATLNDPESFFKKAYYSFLKNSLTGNPYDIEKTEAAFEKALASFPESVDLQLLYLTHNLKLHRLEAAKAGIAKLSFMDDDPKVQVLKTDIAIQEGHYTAAATRLQNILGKNRTWDNLSRLAYLRAKQGNFDEADRLYREAEEEISAKDMRSYAWVELQRGYLALSRGQYQAAWDHYRQADHAYSGYWLTQEYMAEWLGTQRNFEAAAALYRRIATCAIRPDLYHALGDLYLFMGRPELAQPWHDKALAVYLDSARRGEARYYHHLASLYADARLDGAEAVKWARKDIELRQNAATRDALAWALFRNGQYRESLDEIKKVLSYDWQDAHLFYHAAMIHLAAGRAEEGKDYLQKAVRINPHYDAFHVHR
ncbi:MAG: tetratricopeptide repeat protein [Methylomicrobium sp.]